MEISTLTVSTKVTNMATFPATTGNENKSSKVVTNAEKTKAKSMLIYHHKNAEHSRNKRWLTKPSKLLQSSNYLEDSHKCEHAYLIFTLNSPSPFPSKSYTSHR